MAKKTKSGCFESVYPVFIYCWHYIELIEIWTKRLCKESKVAHVCATIFLFRAYLNWFVAPLQQHCKEWRWALGLGCRTWALWGKEMVLQKTWENCGHQGQNWQEHLRVSAWSLGMFIFHCQSPGAGFLIHHCAIGVVSMEMEYKWQSHKRTNWRLCASLFRTHIEFKVGFAKLLLDRKTAN